MKNHTLQSFIRWQATGMLLAVMAKANPAAVLFWQWKRT
jgi:hypothetical protein